MAGVAVALGIMAFVANRPAPPTPEAGRPAVWSVPADGLRAVRISLAAPARSEAWVTLDGQTWRFAAPGGPPVDARRWGGVPLLLSGPRAERLIAANASSTQLAAYGFTPPVLQVELTLANGEAIAIEVGDGTPDGNARYIRLRQGGDIHAVHHAWFDTLARLVLEPPYPPAGGQP